MIYIALLIFAILGFGLMLWSWPKKHYERRGGSWPMDDL